LPPLAAIKKGGGIFAASPQRKKRKQKITKSVGGGLAQVGGKVRTSKSGALLPPHLRQAACSLP